MLDERQQSSVRGLYLIGDVGGGGSLGEAWASARRAWSGIRADLGVGGVAAGR
ncbi:MAG: hypothetical protein R3F30_04370 [Planctomycetota bacterium]